jgi:membrane fusion protein
LPLKAGLTLEADVLQERRKVWEWVLEAVLAEVAAVAMAALAATDGLVFAATPLGGVAAVIGACNYSSNYWSDGDDSKVKVKCSL